MKTIKRVLCIFLIVVMCLTSAPLQGFVNLDWSWLDFGVKASALAATGQCGDNVYWNYNSATGELVISGTGAMYDYSWTFSPFYDSGVKSVVIENNITHIGNCVFYYCLKLTKIVLPVSVIEIREDAFHFCDNITDVYYQGTEEQWYNNIYFDIGGYPKGTIHYNYQASKGQSNNTNAKNHIIKVVDKKGNAIKQAEVCFDGQCKKTDNAGEVSFSKAADKAHITITKSGYIKYDSNGTNTNSKYTLEKTGKTCFVMYKTGDDDAYRLQTATYVDTLYEKNVLTGIKTLSLSDDFSWIDNGKFKLYVSANVTSGIKKYVLYQNSNKIANSLNGEFTQLKVSDFKKGEGVTVRVYYTDRNFVTTKINLKFEEDKSVSEDSIQIGGDGFKLKINDDVPILGGSEFSIDFPILPVEVYVDNDGDGGGKIHVGINADIYKGTKGANGQWEKDDKDSANKSIKKIKEAFKLLKEYKDGVKKEWNKSDKKKLEGILKKKEKSNLPGLDGCDISFVGYGEGAYSKESGASIKVDIYVMAELKGFETTQQYLVWVVPLVVTFEAGVELKSEATGVWNITQKSFAADWVANIKPNLKAMGGVGIGKVVNAGVRGKANLDVQIQLLGHTAPTGVNYINLSGDYGLTANFAIWHYDKSLGNKTYYLYNRNTKKKLNAKAPSANIQEQVYDLEEYELHDLSYLENESEWISQPIQTYSRTRNVDNGTYNPVNILLANTYKNMQPMIVTTNDNKIVSAFLWADTSRNTYNAPVAVYSVYDVATNSWAEPVPFDNNKTLDSVPYLYTDGNDIYAVYLDSSMAITKNDSINDYAVKQNVVVAKYNKTTGAFDEIEVVESANGDFKSIPQIAIVADVPTVVWQSNNNDPFGLCNENTLYKSEYIGGKWADKEMIVENQNGFVGLAADKAGISYITDGDNNFATTEDRTIYFSENYKDFIELETATVSNPVFSENGELYWYSNSTLKTYSDEVVNLYTDGIAGFTDKFDIINNKVYYVGTSEEGKNLYVLTYDESSDSWNAPVQITNQVNDIDYFTVGNIGGKTIAAMTIRDYTITEDAFEDTCNLAYVILEDKHDVVLEYVDYDHDAVVPSTNLPLTVGVLNNGSTDLSEIDVAILNGEDNIVYENSYETILKPGESGELVVDMPLGEEITFSDYKVVINESNSDDIDLSNNEYEITIGYCDFDVTAEPIIVNDVRYAMINVTNKSYTKSAGVLNIYNDIDSETPVDSVAIDELAYGESIIYQLPIDEEILGDEEGVITINALSDVEPYNSYNCKEEMYFNISSSTIIETYEVTWIVDDKEDVYTYEEGDIIEAPEDPQKEGFYFIGWTPEVPDTMPAENLSFTAQWLSVDDPKACELFGCKYESVITPPSCTSQGYTTYTCAVCGEGYTSDITDMTSHNLSEWYEILPATCETIGKEQRDCLECSYFENQDIPAAKHSYEAVITPATCYSNGFTTNTCTKCGNGYTSDITEMLTHNLSDWYTVTAATCKSSGVEQRDCSACDYSETQNIPATGHNYNNGVCTSCGDDLTANCSCNCHAGGIKGLIFKLILFFQKLFRLNRICEGCGARHY